MSVTRPAIRKTIWCVSAGLASAVAILIGCSHVAAPAVRAAVYDPQDPVDPEMLNPNPFGQDPGDDDAMPRTAPKSKTRAARKKGRGPAKGTSKKEDESKKKSTETAAAETGTTELKFSQDIAGILAKNCSGCHGGTGNGLRRGKLDLTSYEKMMKGTPSNPKVVSPGNPEESSLVLRLRGEGGARMPQGNQNVLSDAAIAKIEQWVKAGARLDQGIDPKTAMDSYAPSPDQMLRREIGKLSPQERDKKVEEVGLARWKQANPKLKPEVVSSTRFIMFSNLPAERAKKDLAILDRQYSVLKGLLGSPSMDWVEKMSLFVFTDRKDFIEFVRTVETREIEADVMTSAKLLGGQPYIAAVDPLAGKKEEPTARRKGRAKRGGDDKGTTGPDRSLVGLVTEQLGSAAYVSAAGEQTPPRWLREGFGTYLASLVEPRSQYYQQLRKTAFTVFQQGWETKAAEVLGGTDKIAGDDLHAVSFALVEAMMKSELRQGFGSFLNGMMGGAAKLDEMLGKVYDYKNRDEFLEDTRDFVATQYGNDQ